MVVVSWSEEGEEEDENGRRTTDNWFPPQPRDCWNLTALSGTTNDWRNRQRVVLDLFLNWKWVRSMGFFGGPLGPSDDPTWTNFGKQNCPKMFRKTPLRTNYFSNFLRKFRIWPFFQLFIWCEFDFQAGWIKSEGVRDRSVHPLFSLPSFSSWQSGHDVHYFCCCHFVMLLSLFSEYCTGSRVVFHNVSSKHNSSFVLWNPGSNLEFKMT